MTSFKNCFEEANIVLCVESDFFSFTNFLKYFIAQTKCNAMDIHIMKATFWGTLFLAYS